MSQNVPFLEVARAGRKIGDDLGDGREGGGGDDGDGVMSCGAIGGDDGVGGSNRGGTMM